MGFRTQRVLDVALAVMLMSCGEQAASVGEIIVTETDSAGIRTVTISGPIAALPEWTLSETPLTEISGKASPFLGRVGEVAFLGERSLVPDQA